MPGNLFYLSLLCLLGGHAAFAQNGLILSEKELSRKFWVEKPGTAVKATIWLSTKRDGEMEVKIEPAVMALESEDGRMDGSVKVPQTPLKLKKDKKEPVSIEFSGYRRYGTYCGKLNLWNDPAGEQITIDISFDIRAVPALKSLDGALNLNAVKPNPFTFWLAPQLLEEGERIHFQFENKPADSVEMEPAEIDLKEKHTARSFEDDAFSFEHDTLLKAAKTVRIPMNLKNLNMPAGTYEGFAHFTPSGWRERAEVVRLTLNLRDGPLWAFIALVFGVFVGNLARRLRDTQDKRRQDWLARHGQLVARLASIQDPNYRTYLEQKLSKTEALINSKEAQEAEVETRLQINADQIELLDHLEELAAKIQVPEVADHLKTRIKDAFNCIQQEKFDEAQKVMDDLGKELNRSEARSEMGAHGARLPTNLERLQRGNRVLSEHCRHLEYLERRRPKMGHKALGVVLGMRFDPEARHWWLRAVVWLLILVSSLLLGLHTLYVKDGATFGAGGIYDYLGVFLWGVSSDLAQGALSTLTFPKRPGS
ncbi:MAG: hypothetical protein QNK37_21490 [Acidobacteriota bacterium]|nr:hypothetical protein [Acidobacteriota bacterium]